MLTSRVITRKLHPIFSSRLLSPATICSQDVLPSPPGFSWLKRRMTLEAEASSPKPVQPKSYPFSEAIVSSPEPIPYDPKLGLMGNVEKKLISTCKNLEFHSLFRKNHPDSIRPLSVVRVESYTNAARTTTSVFTGVLMAVRRRGTETSFRLRAVVERVGIEMKFNVFSPVIKDITVVKRAGDLEGSTNGKPLIRKPRRAKLFYLRDHPQKMPDIRKVMKAVAAGKTGTSSQ